MKKELKDKCHCSGQININYLISSSALTELNRNTFCLCLFFGKELSKTLKLFVLVQPNQQQSVNIEPILHSSFLKIFALMGFHLNYKITGFPHVDFLTFIFADMKLEINTIPRC